MVRIAKTRTELFGQISRRLEANTELLRRTAGEPPEARLLKVFWIEVNPDHTPSPQFTRAWRETDRRFFVFARNGSPTIWLDASDDRIWRAFSFGSTKRVDLILKRAFFRRRGFDRVWLTEPFLEKLRRSHGYQDRGFRLSFRDALSEAKNPSERPRFSAKFWLGEEIPEKQRRFLEAAREAFSKSSLRMGRESRRPDSRVSGLLVEAYARGSMTVTASEEPEEVLGLANEIGRGYRTELTEMESRRDKSSRPVELDFATTVNLERFQRLVEAGQGQTRLWMQRYEVEDGLHRYTGVDLHTNELINLDIGPDYAYLVTRRRGCMNAAPRLMTISAEGISGKTSLFYEGVPLFA